MAGQRTMAGFAADVGMLATFLHFEDIGMAGFARLVTSKVNWVGGNFTHCSTAVVAIFSEGLRHNEMTSHEKYHETNDKQ